MPTKKISELVAASSLVPIDQLVVVQGGVTKRATMSQFIAAVDLDYVPQSEFDAQGPSGRELAYAETFATLSGVAGTATDIPGLSITFTVANRPVYVELDLPWVSSSAAAGTVSAIIAQTNGTATRQAGASFSATEVHAIKVIERIAVPGTYTRKARLQRGGGTATFGINLGFSSIMSTLGAYER